LTVLTNATLARSNNALPEDGVTVTPKHVAAVLMLILILFLRQLNSASVGE